MTYARACPVSDLVEDVPRGVDLGRSRVALVRSRGRLFAVDDECSHARILLSVGDFDPEEATLECFGHGARFDLATGEPLDLPASIAVRVHPTVIDGEHVLVDLDNPIQEY